jgi:hypothetical protein
MNEIAFISYFGLAFLIVFVYLKSRWDKKQENENKKLKNIHSTTSGLLTLNKDYFEEDGLVKFDIASITESEIFNKVILKNLDKEWEVEQKKLLHDHVMNMQYYGMADLFKISEHLRKYKDQTGQTVLLYKSIITACAVVYDFMIPKSLMNADSLALLYVAAYFRANSTTCVYEEIQKHIKSNLKEKRLDNVAKEHAQLKALLLDMDFANVFFQEIFKHKSYLGLEYLHKKWINSNLVCKDNLDLYKNDISCFKKLLTIYFGILQIHIPASYLYIDTSVCEYLLQIKRYDLNKPHIRAV